MADTYTVTGTLTDSQTVQLDESLPLTSQKVRLVVEPIPPVRVTHSYQETIQKIRARQKSRGHQAPTRKEVDLYLSTERDSWE